MKSGVQLHHSADLSTSSLDGKSTELFSSLSANSCVVDTVLYADGTLHLTERPVFNTRGFSLKFNNFTISNKELIPSLIKRYWPKPPAS